MAYKSGDVVKHQVLQRDLDKDSITLLLKGGGTQELKASKHRYYMLDNKDTTFHVGDIWVMAGQDNMQGLGDIFDVLTMKSLQKPVRHDKVYLYDSSEHWRKFNQDPLHELDKSPRTITHVLSGFFAKHLHTLEFKGASLAPGFVNAFKKINAGLPIGLVACAQEQSTSKVWMTTNKDPYNSVYGAMLDKIRKIGGRVAGVLWYQGESDAIKSTNADNYASFFQNWISELRRDLDQPNLPVVFVQIGSHNLTSPEAKENWKKIQEVQFGFFGQSPYVAGVASLDAALDSSYILSAAGLSLVGKRLAYAADKAMKGQGDKATPLPLSAFRQKYIQHYESSTFEIMSVNLKFKHLDSPWKLRPDQSVVGFSFGEQEIPIIKAFVADTKTGTVRLYLPEAIDEPFTLHYGMQPGQANLITKDGRALPAFRNFLV
ncbi:SGNH hydrolase-type esterase domain-containing protein [Choanephora cucurbitarum]|nr:SGNH hydrolase-type esterase domain-containing protein [Choanephora cucurbitarum]